MYIICLYLDVLIFEHNTVYTKYINQIQFGTLDTFSYVLHINCQLVPSPCTLHRLTPRILGIFSCFCCHLADFFSKLVFFFSKNSFRNTFKEINDMLLVLHPMESISLNSFVLLERLAMLLTSTLAINC